MGARAIASDGEVAMAQTILIQFPSECSGRRVKKEWHDSGGGSAQRQAALDFFCSRLYPAAWSSSRTAWLQLLFSISHSPETLMDVS
jgi:hypothetical protein